MGTLYGEELSGCTCVSLFQIIEDGKAAQGVCEVFCVLIACVLAFDTDGGPKLQWAAAIQKEEKRWLKWGDRGGREAWENPQMYCGESVVIEQRVCPVVS